MNSRAPVSLPSQILVLPCAKPPVEQTRRPLVVSKVEKRGVISGEKNSPEFAYVLLSGVALIACRNRKGLRTLLMIVAPGLTPGFPPKVVGIKYDFRCEAVTDC